MRRFFVLTLGLLFYFLTARVHVGESTAVASNFMYPVTYDYISTYFSDWHPGIDMATECGTPVYSSKWGNVTYAGWDDTGYGNLIMIDDGIDFEKYGHLSGFNVSYGQYANQGDLLGWVGTTGNSTGCHLHFETHYEEWGLPPYGGAIDPFVALP